MILFALKFGFYCDAPWEDAKKEDGKEMHIQ